MIRLVDSKRTILKFQILTTCYLKVERRLNAVKHERWEHEYYYEKPFELWLHNRPANHWTGKNAETKVKGKTWTGASYGNGEIIRL